MRRFHSDAPAGQKRQTRAVHVLAGFAALTLLILLIVLTRFAPDRETGSRVVGIVCFFWLFSAVRDQIYRLGDLVEQRFGRLGSPAPPGSAAVNKRGKEDWPRIGVNVSTFLALSILIMSAPQGMGSRNPQDELRQHTSHAQSSSRQATLAYWQSTVANLHPVRFSTPSGEEPAEQYYERIFQQLRNQVAAARSAATHNVDPELVQLVTRHLQVDEQCLQMKEQLDPFMREQQLPTPTDTIDQRMNASRWLLGTMELNPQLLAELPPGPERDWIEKVKELERLRQETFREIEIQQAVLQERYQGLAFPLPAIR